MIIPLQTPFLYDPNAGNLLLEVRNFTAEKTTQIDAQYGSSPDSISRMWNPENMNAPSGEADTIGIKMQFTLVVVPEPTTWSLVAISVLIFGFYSIAGKRSVVCEISSAVTRNLRLSSLQNPAARRKY